MAPRAGGASLRVTRVALWITDPMSDFRTSPAFSAWNSFRPRPGQERWCARPSRCWRSSPVRQRDLRRGRFHPRRHGGCCAQRCATRLATRRRTCHASAPAPGPARHPPCLQEQARSVVALVRRPPSGMGGDAGELRYANELISFIRQETGRLVPHRGRPIPVRHPQAASVSADMDHFQAKVKAALMPPSPSTSSTPTPTSISSTGPRPKACGC